MSYELSSCHSDLTPIFEPPKTSSNEPITDTARRIRERRRNEEGAEEVLFLAAICLAIAIGILMQG